MILILSPIITNGGNVKGENISNMEKMTNINSQNVDSLTGEILLNHSKIAMDGSDAPSLNAEKSTIESFDLNDSGSGLEPSKIHNSYIRPPATPLHDEYEVESVIIDETTQVKLKPQTKQNHGPMCDFDKDTSAYRSTRDATPTGETYMLFDDWGGTWCDAEKSPTNTEDDDLCWAAAASNVLEWTGWGKVGGMITSDDMFQHFQDHWTDDGGWPEYAWEWWFDGTCDAPSGSTVDVPGGGGFYPTENFYSYYYESWTESLALTKIDEFLHGGCGVTLLIYGPGAHAITCWGFNHATGIPTDYVGVWVTDSDDDKGSSTPPDRLRYYEISQVSGTWYLQDYYGSNDWYLWGVEALELNPASGSVEITSPSDGDYIKDTITISGVASSAMDTEIFTEDFEGAFPGAWTVGDSDSGNGEDYWDDTAYRSYDGSWSGWCADIGSTGGTTTLFTENFEGAWPGSWTISDQNSQNGDDYWGDNTHRSHGGSWSGWCADIGTSTNILYTQNFNNAGSMPSGWTTYNEGPDDYPWTMRLDSGSDYRAEANSFEAGSGTSIKEWLYMTTSFDASSYIDLELQFYLDYNYFDGDEYAQVLYATSSSYPTFFNLQTWNSDTTGTQYVDLSAAAGDSQVHIAFIYHGTYDWYMRVDDVIVSGNVPNNIINKYDNGMSSWMIRDHLI